MRTLVLSLIATALSAQTVVNGGRTILGSLDASGATRTAPAKSGTSLPGTCTVGDEYNKTDATSTAVKHICTATNTWTQQTGTGGGGAALTSNAGDSAFMPWGLCRFNADLNTIISSGDTQLYAFESDVSKQYREIGFVVTGAAGSGKGMVASIYTRASNGDLTRIAISAGVLVDSTGKKYPAWSSGSAVSGGVLTLPAGQNLYFALTLDAQAGSAPGIRFYDEAGAEVLGLITKDFTSTQKRTAVAASSSSGNGTSVTSPATIANASYAVVNEYRPLVAFLP